MSLRILLILAYLLAILSCKNSSKTKVQDQTVKPVSIAMADTIPQPDRQNQDTVILDSFGTSKNTNRSKIEITSVNKFLDSNSAYYNRRKEDCFNWNLSKEDIKKILVTSEDIDAGSEFHNLYDVFPCSYTGIIIMDGKHGKYMINAGAFSRIEFKDTTFLMGYKRKDYKRYFLLGPGI